MPEGLTRRGLFALGGRVAATALVGGLATKGLIDVTRPALANAGSGKKTIRIGYLPITDASALLSAYDLGIFERHGLVAERPVLFRSWESLAQAFALGEVDVVHLLMPLAVQLRLAKQVPLKVIAWGHTNGSAVTVAPQISSTEQLAGSTFAIPYWWSIHNIVLQRLLSRHGLTPVVRETPSASSGTVQLAVMAPADMVPALASGQISGFVVADPFSAVAEAKQVGHVHRFLGDVWKDHACCGITVRQDLIDQHPDTVQSIASAITEAQQWLEGNRAGAGAILAGDGKYLPQPVPAVSKVFTRDPASYAGVTQHADWHGERLGFSGLPLRSYTDALVTAMGATTVDGDTSFLGRLAATEVHNDIVDDRFVRAAHGNVGTDSLTRVEEIQP